MTRCAGRNTTLNGWLYKCLNYSDLDLFEEEEEEEDGGGAVEVSLLFLSLDAPSLWLRQVQSSVSLCREASGRPLMEAVSGDEAAALQEADSGVARLRAGDPFSEEMSALWLAVQSLGFVLICEPHENLLLAEGTLRNLTRHCLETLRMLGPGSEVRTRTSQQVPTSKRRLQ